MNLKKKLEKIWQSNTTDILIIIGFILVGFVLRFSGILSEHSFWADEAYVSSVARDIVQGKASISDLPSTLGAVYQPLHVILIAIFFKLFWVGETMARLPSVLLGTLGIPFMYLVARNWGGRNAALISTFVYTFSQLQLVHATQAKPYTAISTLFLVLIYLLQKLSEKKHTARQSILMHIGVLVLIILMAALHVLSLLFVFVYGVFLIRMYGRGLLQSKRKWYIVVGSGFAILASSLYIARIGLLPQTLFTVNNITYFREFFFHQYLFLTIPAAFGLWLMRKKYPAIMPSMVIWAIVLLIFWTFIHYSRNIRYIVPLVTIMQVFFGIFWAHVFEKLFPRKNLIVTMLFILMLFVGWGKIVRKPSQYYSPNADIFADVQNADYKSAYNFVMQKYPSHPEMVIFNNIIDVQKYYLPLKQDADAYFMKGISTPQKHGVNGVMIYGTLDDFLKVQSQHPQGLLIVEDWESLLPEDIKQYAKINMKLEYRVESMDVAPTDKWPIEIYSWGMEENTDE